MSAEKEHNPFSASTVDGRKNDGHKQQEKVWFEFRQKFLLLRRVRCWRSIKSAFSKLGKERLEKDQLEVTEKGLWPLRTPSYLTVNFTDRYVYDIVSVTWLHQDKTMIF